MLHLVCLQQENCICVGFLCWSWHCAQYNHCAEHYDYLYHWNSHLVLMYSPASSSTEVFPQEIKLHIRRSSMRFCFKFRETVLQNQIQSFSTQLNFTMCNSIFPPRGSIEHKASVSELQDSHTQHGKLGSPYGFHVVSHVPPMSDIQHIGIPNLWAWNKSTKKGKLTVKSLRAKMRLSNCNFSQCLIKRSP